MNIFCAVDSACNAVYLLMVLVVSIDPEQFRNWGIFQEILWNLSLLNEHLPEHVKQLSELQVLTEFPGHRDGVHTAVAGCVVPGKVGRQDGALVTGGPAPTGG